MHDLIESNIDFEIFVMDNGSTDKTKEILNGYSEKANLIFLDQNKGTTFPRNLAIKKSTGDYILFLDSDTEIKSKKTIKNLILIAKNNKGFGIIAPKLILSDGTMQVSFKKFPTLFLKILKTIPLNFLRRLTLKSESYDFSIDNNKFYLVDYCISACWLVPKKVINQVGLLDERIFYSPEDVDFCLRIWKAGYKVVWSPTVEVIHYCQRISYKNPKIALSHFLGLLYFFRKHNYYFFRSKIYKIIK
jgi:hypothetical protein